MHWVIDFHSSPANFISYLKNSSSKLRSQSPSPKHWLIFSIGRSGFHVNALLNTVTNRIGVELVIADKDGEKSFYYLLEKDKEAIEMEMGSGWNIFECGVKKVPT
jgi:hypothetical protein